MFDITKHQDFPEHLKPVDRSQKIRLCVNTKNGCDRGQDCEFIHYNELTRATFLLDITDPLYGFEHENEMIKWIRKNHNYPTTIFGGMKLQKIQDKFTKEINDFPLTDPTPLNQSSYEENETQQFAKNLRYAEFMRKEMAIRWRYNYNLKNQRTL